MSPQNYSDRLKLFRIADVMRTAEGAKVPSGTMVTIIEIDANNVCIYNETKSYLAYKMDDNSPYVNFNGKFIIVNKIPKEFYTMTPFNKNIGKYDIDDNIVHVEPSYHTIPREKVFKYTSWDVSAYFNDQYRSNSTDYMYEIPITDMMDMIECVAGRIGVRNGNTLGHYAPTFSTWSLVNSSYVNGIIYTNDLPRILDVVLKLKNDINRVKNQNNKDVDRMYREKVISEINRLPLTTIKNIAQTFNIAGE